jgi:DNA modification methylase
MPMKVHENILVFYKQLPTYNPQMTTGHKPMNVSYGGHRAGDNYGDYKNVDCGGNTDRFPRDVIKFNSVNPNDKHGKFPHPTQKPVELCRYLIETYTNQGDLVLDNCMGSGTTAVAALSCDRNFIGVEKDLKYVNMA